ncbi:MAG TPA: tyrosine-type recombinase/integrase [Candidatus Bathyarchaeia archaeon]|nr:tyrosine-type recombinase/integrase [Candidatus Bathyarchaeia archaeon]
MKKNNLPCFDDFLLYLKTQNFSEETIYNYERDLKVFDTFLSTSPLPFEKITKKTVVEYKAYLISQDRQTSIREEKTGFKLASSSINRMLSALRSYLKYLIEMDQQVPVAPDSIKLIKTEKKKAKVAELEELVRLIEAPSTFEANPQVGLRNRAILELLFSTGMRISELCHLNRADIDHTGRIFIMGKGKKERFVYLTPRARQHLERYLATRNDSCPALFIPYSGSQVNSIKKRISTNYIQAKIKEYREKLRINVPTSAHSLRHGFATYLAEKGASPVAIQILLGHESLDTTTRYVHASDKFAEQTHKQYHPLSNISKR